MTHDDPRPGHRASATPQRPHPRPDSSAAPETAPPIRLATRGSALALAQANAVLAECRAAFPELAFELKIIKTTGDKLQTAALGQADEPLPKGLFTKELEAALLANEADLAVHSLKDLPTELPPGLKLGAVGKRADARDVLVYRDAGLPGAPSGATPTEWTPGQRVQRALKPGARIKDLPVGATVATSSPRRKAQLLALRPDLSVVELRGNVGTRLQKLATQPEFDATVLAAAGLGRLKFQILPNGRLRGAGVPAGLCATVLDPAEMLPCVGQGAIGIEVRAEDKRLEPICQRLTHWNTLQCVTAERAFLAAMGGGCQSPVAAYAQVLGHQLRLRAVSFKRPPARRAEGARRVSQAEELGRQVAAEIL
ncbi:MAG: hydroxymethylbilane synthase [Verrucomicrobia bacterium]|nr:hydroxymethylbilane synthase [Verrucomicrobiota bacterium]